jgi:haloalkane dehalogenase
MSSPADASALITRSAAHDGGTVHIVERPGGDPPLVLMHGFPDDLRIYDRLIPLLAPRRVIAFDWLGYGRSARPQNRAFAPSDRMRDLSTVLDMLALERVVLVGHDASGPEAIDYALAQPHRVQRLVLLNTYYGHSTSLHLPEVIRLLADPELRPLADAMIDDDQQRLWLLAHTARQFGLDPADMTGIGAHAVLPQFFAGPAGPDALTEIRAWTAHLFEALDVQDRRVQAGDLDQFEPPVTVIFGASDQYLGPQLARHLAGLFPDAELHLVEGAAHWPQWDQSKTVAKLIGKAIARSTDRRQTTHPGTD